MIYVVTGSSPRRSAVARALARGQARTWQATTIRVEDLDDPIVRGEVLRTGGRGLVVETADVLSTGWAERAAQQFRALTILTQRLHAEPVLVQTPTLVFSARRLSVPLDGHEFLFEVRV